MKSRVLVVEDDRDLAELTEHTLERSGETEAASAAAGHTALRATTG